DPNAKLYHRDGFLHFWAPYVSQNPAGAEIYNLNPFTHFVHDASGIDARGAYSFSIDDFYGNFGGFASTLIINVGGTTALPDKEPFDPYKRYNVAWGNGWHHLDICGRRLDVPNPLLGLSTAFSFWRNGSQLNPKECIITLYATPEEMGPSAKFVKYKVSEVT